MPTSLRLTLALRPLALWVLLRQAQSLSALRLSVETSVRLFELFVTVPTYFPASCQLGTRFLSWSDGAG